jgi:hypothetical protein
MSEKIAQNLGELAEAFLLSKRVGGCSGRTLTAYGYWLHRLPAEVTALTIRHPGVGNRPVAD